MQDLLANGIHASTGLPLLAGCTLEDIAKIAFDQKTDPISEAELYGQFRRKRRSQTRAPIQGIDADKLAEAGWAVIFAPNMDAEKKALAPLLDLRHRQAGDRYKACTFQPGETKQSFLQSRTGVTTGPVDPALMPFYLLLVGSPEAIPYEVQYELDIQYAVGRIHFDKIEDYSAYAAAVVAAEDEDNAITVQRHAAFVGVKNQDDSSTATSLEHLVQPLVTALAKEQTHWTISSYLEEKAYKRDLLQLLQSSQPPALLFTASHGICYNSGDPLQHRYQGALIMEDFALGSGPPSLDQCFSADDAAHIKTPGMIAFNFACFGAGTPSDNNFYKYTKSKPGKAQTLSQAPFLAALPKRLLANGALAAIGHVDTAFASTFREGASTAAYQSALQKILEGGRVGVAMDYFNLRHAELSVGLTTQIDKTKRNNPEVIEDLASRWLANNDARNYIIVGDPAVKLPLAPDPGLMAREIADLEAELALRKQKLQQARQAGYSATSPR